jgi:hypothetical protein
LAAAPAPSASRPGSAINIFRAARVTVDLKNGGPPENTAAMAIHTSTQRDDRRRNRFMIDEVERISI